MLDPNIGRMILAAFPLLAIGFMIFAVYNARRSMKVQAYNLHQIEESLARQRESMDVQRRVASLAEENLAVQHEIHDLLARMVVALERRV